MRFGKQIFYLINSSFFNPFSVDGIGVYHSCPHKLMLYDIVQEIISWTVVYDRILLIRPVVQSDIQFSIYQRHYLIQCQVVP